MSVFGLMRTGVSGMGAQSGRLSTVADNIANSSTVGYKAANAQFSSLLISSSPASYSPGGVETEIRREVSKQGTLTLTSSQYDLAINGDGFMLVADPNGRMVLTRSGAFVPDSSGRLVNSAGFNLLGYPIDGSAANRGTTGIAGLVPVQVNQDRLQAIATTKGQLIANLPSNATVGALSSANNAGLAGSAVTSMVVYGSAGEEIVLDINFTKTSKGEWTAAAFNSLDRSATSGSYDAAPLATAALSFDEHGELEVGSASSLTIPIPDGAPFHLDLSNTTQLATDYTVNGISVNGSAPSSIATLKIEDDGTAYEIHDNGARRAAFKIPLASVASPDKLSAKSGDIFEPTINSGESAVGTAGMGGLGTITAGALESSSVDIAAELTEMIEAQRNYTANSKVFQTGAELLETLINLKR